MAPDPMKPTARPFPARAVVAHVLMVGAYVLAIAVALVLVASPFVEWWVLGRLDVEVLAGVVVGVVMFRLLVPDPVRFEPAGPAVDRTEQPELFEVLDMVASATRQPMPDTVHLLEEMNAYVAEVGGFLGIGTRRVMGIGVPLMSVLDPEEFGAVLAHEFGHLHREAGRIGALVYMTRQAVARQVIDAPPTLVRRPLMACARAYLRATLPIAREQELAADALAARATSVRASAGSLSRLPFGTVAFDVFHRTEYLPLVEAGRRPPLLGGFETFLTSSVAREHLPAARDAALGSTTSSDLDAHPSVPERLAALGASPTDFDDRPLPEVTAAELLRDHDALEEVLARRHLPEGAPLAPIAWEDVGREILVPRWTAERRELVGDLPEGFHLGALPLDRPSLAELGAEIACREGDETADGDALVASGHRAARAIIGELAAAHGMAVEMVPGEPVWFGRPPEQYGLFAAYDAVVEGRDQPSLWFGLLAEAGLAPAGVPAPVGAPAAAPAPAPAPVASTREPAPPTPAPSVTATPAAPPPVPVPPAPTPDPAPALDLRSTPPAPPVAPVRPTEPAPPRHLDPVLGRSGGWEPHRRKAFRIPAGMGRVHDLVLDGDTVSFRGESVSADDVTHVAYWSGEDAEVRLWADDRLLRVKLAGGQKAHDAAGPAWEATVAWIDANVAPRLVARAMDRVAERGRVQVGDQVVTSGGVVVRGRVVPWSVLTGAALEGRSIQIRQRTEGEPRGTVIATLDASEPNMVLVPPLMVAASSAAAAERSGAVASPEHAH